MNQTAAAQPLSSSTQNIKLCYLIFFVVVFYFHAQGFPGAMVALSLFIAARMDGIKSFVNEE